MNVEEKELILKVANLIEQGSKGMGQITGKFFEKNMSACCAMGAVLKASGYNSQNKIDTTDLLQIFGVYTWPRVIYPIKESFMPFATNNDGTAPLPDVVICLNDREAWSFEHIAAFLRDCTLDTSELSVDTNI